MTSPVAEPEAHRRASATARPQPVDDRLRRLFVRQARELRRVDELAVVFDNGLDREIEPLRERSIALVVRRDGHDRARPVIHQDVVGNPDGNARVVDRVRREEAGEDAGLVASPLRAPLQAWPPALRAYSRISSPFGDRSASSVDQRMLGREHEERRAEERVRTRGEDRDVDVAARRRGRGSPRLRSGRSSCAASLATRSGQSTSVELVEQVVGVRGDAEEPLLELALLDLGAAAFAVAVLHLLVREHGLVVRAPVDGRLLAVGEPAPRGTAGTATASSGSIGLVRRELARPVDRPAHALHLVADPFDVALDDLARMLALLERRVLGGQPERVVAHRTQHLVARAAVEMREDVTERVDEHVPDVQRARRIREHLEHVVLALVPRRAGLRVRNLERAVLVPNPLPFRSRLSAARICP